MESMRRIAGLDLLDDPDMRRLKEAAMEAEEHFCLDELEEYAEAVRRDREARQPRGGDRNVR